MLQENANTEDDCDSTAAFVGEPKYLLPNSEKNLVVETTKHSLVMHKFPHESSGGATIHNCGCYSRRDGDRTEMSHR